MQLSLPVRRSIRALGSAGRTPAFALFAILAFVLLPVRLARRGRALALVACIPLLALPYAPLAGAFGGEQDQSQTVIDNDPAFVVNLNSVRRAQTFTAGKTGALDRIDLPLSQDKDGTPGDLVIEIRTTSNGVPTGTILKAVTVPAGSLERLPTFPDFTWAIMELDDPPHVNAGTQYAFVLRAKTELFLWTAGSREDPYGEGALYNQAGTTTWDPVAKGEADLAFVTYVQTDVTPPTSTISFPADDGAYNTLNWAAGCGSSIFAHDICGTAADDPGGSGLEMTAVSIKQEATGKWWDGTAFQSDDEFHYEVPGEDWTLQFPAERFTADGRYSVHARAVDNAGNVGERQIHTFSIDNAPPTSTLTFPVDRATYTPTSWNAGCSTGGGDVCGSANGTGSGVLQVEVRIQRQSDSKIWNGSDWTSNDTWLVATGKETWSYALAASNLTDGETYTVSARATDAAGNVESTSSATFTFQNDTSPPKTTASPSGTLGDNGWYTSAVEVTLSATDDGFGVDRTLYRIDGGAIQTYSGPFTVSGDDTHTVEYWSEDTSGNVEPTRSLSVNIDATPPVVTAGAAPGPNANGWNNTDVTVTASGADATSGIASCDSSIVVSAEGANQSRTLSCTDNAGNSASATATVSIDKTAPTVTGTPDRSANLNGWYNGSLTVTWSGTDALSGVDTCTSPTSYGGPDSASASVSGSCADKAGNTGNASFGFKYDATPPVITLSGNAGTYQVDDVVSIDCTATDATSGIDLANTSCADTNAPAYSFDPGSNTIEATATDLAGNTTTASTTFTVEVTTESLKNLVDEFVSHPGLAKSLKAKLDASKGGRGRRTDGGTIQAFIDQVNALRGSELTDEEADVLIRWAEAL